MRIDPLTLLERTDKWFLGGGRATLFAPAFPRNLDTPGFWDEAYFAEIRLERLFCLLLLDDHGKPLNLRRAVRRWTPDRLMQIYTIEGLPGLQLQEERVVTPNDTLACRVTFTNTHSQTVRLHLMLWSLQAHRSDPHATSVEDVERDLDGFSFVQRMGAEPPGQTLSSAPDWQVAEIQEPKRVYVALGGSRLPDSWTVNLAESLETSPLWQASVFPEKFRNGTLAREMQAEADGLPNGLLNLALHYVLETPANSAETMTFGASIALDRETALANLRSDMTLNVVALSRSHWQDYFASVPNFDCSDLYLERAYWYRWYGLRLLTVALQTGKLPYPGIFEGIAPFRAQSSIAAACHMRETSWMHNPQIAMGSLENFLASQIQHEEDPKDGLLPGHLSLWQCDPEVAPADWGAAVLQVYHLTGDRDFVRRVYPGLSLYADYLDRALDPEQSGVYDLQRTGETGPETTNRLPFIAQNGSAHTAVRLKGVEVTCYQYSLQRTLAAFARVLGQVDDSEWWDEKADTTGRAIRKRMWDPQAKCFKDTHAETLEHSPVKAVVGFYPFVSDIATIAHLSAWNEHLHNPATFDTPYPMPTISADDPAFDADGAWRGVRANRPRNGRVWPFANAQIMEALAHTARSLAPEMGPEAADFLRRFVRMLFHDGDLKRPNSYEHYNPLTGTPSLSRGVDDYQCSWIVDLILKHVVGIQPAPGRNGTLVIDPLPCQLEAFHARDIHVRGHRIDVIWSRPEGFAVHVDGREVLLLSTPQRVEIPLG